MCLNSWFWPNPSNPAATAEAATARDVKGAVGVVADAIAAAPKDRPTDLSPSEHTLKRVSTRFLRPRNNPDAFGVIEIQGDKREMIRGVLEKKGMRVKV